MTANKTSVLLVCLGNICRSPTAEAVLSKKLQLNGLDIHLDSAGTAGFHTGAAPDKRSQAVAIERGYEFNGIQCRKVTEQDFIEFDYILAMDNENLNHLLAICPAAFQEKVKLYLSFSTSEESEVPDPYYGGKRGFEYVLDLIEQGADGLITHLKLTET